MSIRIRVYPQNGAMGLNGMGLNGMGFRGQGAVSASTYFNSRLQTQKQVSGLQLGYERALWNERLEKVRLEERLKNPYASYGAGVGGFGAGVAGAYGVPVQVPGALGFGGLGGVNPIGSFGYGGLGGINPMGGIPSGFPGSGQSNVTNQTSASTASQSVSNSNVLNISQQQTAPPFGYGSYGYPQSGFGGGGFLSGLLGALI